MKGETLRIVRFWHKHPVLMNFVTIIIVAFLIGWLFGVLFLNWFTGHGQEITMPQVKNLNVEDARRILQDADFEVKLDSVFNSEVAPGTVLRQVPRENSKVKRGGAAFLQYVCYSVRKARIPAFLDGPRSTAMNNFRNAGFENVEIQEIPGNVNDLVIGATYNGLELREGMEVPVNAHIVIKVSTYFQPEETYEDGYQEDADAEFIESLNDDVDDEGWYD